MQQVMFTSLDIMVLKIVLWWYSEKYSFRNYYVKIYTGVEISSNVDVLGSVVKFLAFTLEQNKKQSL